MSQYKDLLLNQCYLIQETKDSEILMVEAVMETNHCLLISFYDTLAGNVWKRKTDSIFSIIEALTPEQIDTYRSLEEGEEDFAFDTLWDEEDEDEDEDWDDDLLADERAKAN
jgi:hypothetical protein